MMVFVALSGFLLVVLSLTTVLNILTFPRLPDTEPSEQPFVSVLIPARNEAVNIFETTTRLLAQTYTSFEVIVLDDASTDNTSQEALRAAGGDTRFRLITGKPLPVGWTGKNWACHQLAEAASGDYLVFTDADVHWEAHALSGLITMSQFHRADMATVWPDQIALTWGERLVVPLINFVILGYIPELAVRFLPLWIFSAANGQCLIFTRDAYHEINGHEAVQNKIVEDVALARLAKKSGHRLMMMLGSRLISTRMYRSWGEVRDGLAKNILAGHGGALPLILSALFHWGIFIMPWLWLALGSNTGGWPAYPLLLISLGIGSRAASAAAGGNRILDALLMPVSVILMTAIAARSLYWHFIKGGPHWKGRHLQSGGSI